jgi:hypothetical protein
MKKSIIIFFIFFIITYFIGTLDKIYKINNLFLFITLNLILILLSIFQILNLKKKYPKIYLVNPPVICTIFTFLIPFSLTNVFLVQSISELIINSDNLFKLFFLIINSFNLMWAGYWSADYFRSKNLFIKNILLKIQQNVVLKFSHVNFIIIFILFLFSFSAFIIMNLLNIYGYNSNQESLGIYIHYRYILHLALNVNYIILIILTLFLFKEKQRIKFKFFYIFFLSIFLLFGIFSGFKSDFFFPFLTIFVIFYILKNKFSFKIFFLTIFFTYFSYYSIEYLRNNIAAIETKKSFSNFQESLSVYNKYFNETKNPNGTKTYLSEFENKTIRIGERLNNFRDSILILNFIDLNPDLLKNSDTPKFLNSILISPITAIVPRIVWKNKPTNLEGTWAANILQKYHCEKNKLICGPVTGSASMSSFLYLYFAGGIFIVFLFYFFLGIFQNIIFNLFNPGKFFAPTLIFLILLPKISLIDSAIYGIISFFFREFIILLIMQYLIFKKKK